MSALGILHRHAAAYGLLAMPLAFVALPMYVNVPHLYATQYAVPLSLLGIVLLLTRLIDALTDPFIGRFSDWLYAKSMHAVVVAALIFSATLAISFAALFNPPVWGSSSAYAMWVAVCVTACHLCYSVLCIVHQAWVTRLGGTAAQQSRVLAWREGSGLWGVVLAAMLPLWLGWSLNALVLGVLLLLGVISWRFAWTHHSTISNLSATNSTAVNSKADAQAHQVFGLFEPFQKKQFSKLLLIFVVNGIASAVPASLVLFFVEDQIRVSASHVPLFLGAYFLSGALSLPLWLMAIKRFDLPRAWLFGMVLAVLSFMGVSQLGAGDEWAYFAICVASGTALGADLVVPGAILNGLIDRWGQRGRAEGVYLGWWNLASKFNLALAAGLSLPLLSWWGYSPGTQDANGLQALSAAYGLFPCALKLLAALLLFLFWRTSAKADASNFSNASNRSLS